MIHAVAIVAGRSKRSRRVLRAAVSGECQRVIEACDAAEAFELSRRYVPDLIVLDRSEVRAMRRLHGDSELANVPVICVPAEPVEPAELSAKVHAALYSRR